MWKCPLTISGGSRTDPYIRSVKLLGSWDNFSKPYCLERDRRIGPGLWKGCFTFSNIIFDGSSAYPSSPRSGGLRMGGTYWFYVRGFLQRKQRSKQC